MGTPYDYFTTDGARLGVFSQRHGVVNRSTGFGVQAMIYRDYGVGAAHVAFWVPHVDPILPALLSLVTRGLIGIVLADAFAFHMSYHGYPGEQLAPRDDLPFSNQVVIYSDDEVSSADFAALSAKAQQEGLFVSVRGPECARIRNEGEKPLGFFSHDSRDKDEAREIVTWLNQRAVRIWFAEYSIPVGASIAGSIDKGLTECPKAILFITPNYLANQSWASIEMQAILNREANSDTSRLVAVWWKVSRADVAKRSTLLPDRLAIIHDGDIEKLGAELYYALTAKRPPIDFLCPWPHGPELRRS